MQCLAFFTTEGRTEGLNSESFDTKLNDLTGRPRIHRSRIHGPVNQLAYIFAQEPVMEPFFSPPSRSSGTKQWMKSS